MKLRDLLLKMYADQKVRIDDNQTVQTVTADVDEIISEHTELLDRTVETIYFSRTFNEVMIDLE